MVLQAASENEVRILYSKHLTTIGKAVKLLYLIECKYKHHMKVHAGHWLQLSKLQVDLASKVSIATCVMRELQSIQACLAVAFNKIYKLCRKTAGTARNRHICRALLQHNCTRSRFSWRLDFVGFSMFNMQGYARGSGFASCTGRNGCSYCSCIQLLTNYGVSRGQYNVRRRRAFLRFSLLVC